MNGKGSKDPSHFVSKGIPIEYLPDISLLCHDNPAYENPHCDAVPSCLPTLACLLRGVKLWVCAKNKNKDFVRWFVRKSWPLPYLLSTLREQTFNKKDLSYAVMGPGDSIFMPAGVPHFVLTVTGVPGLYQEYGRGSALMSSYVLRNSEDMEKGNTMKNTLHLHDKPKRRAVKNPGVRKDKRKMKLRFGRTLTRSAKNS